VRLFVLDPSAGMLRQAQAKGCCRVCQGRSEGLPFPDGIFDRVLAVDSFHHFWDYGEAAREMVRVVAPGGRIVVEEPDVRRFGVKVVALMERLLLMRSHFHRPAALASLFEQAGGRVTLHEEDPINYRAVIERSS
jgi:demethylmenaquinone methyltransferase/2-methoxy-6-polyprenyl-1,4-benzoquinol methylase